MYAGVPNACPVRVRSESVLADGSSQRAGRARDAQPPVRQLATDLGQAPVHDQRLAEFAEHDVAGFRSRCSTPRLWA